MFRFIFTLLLVTMSLIVLAQRSDCPVHQADNTITQPNGEQLTLTSVGNESVHYLETTNGYTVLQNPESGYFEYAQADVAGNLGLSGIIASDKTDAIFHKNGFPLHLRYSEEQKNVLMQYFNAQNSAAWSENLGKSGPNVFPSSGDRKILVLMIEYPDLRATIPGSDFELLFNQPDYNGTGSFKDFYSKASYGKLNLTADVFGWFMADSGYKYYGRTSSPSYNQATRRLLLNALHAADSAGLDFTQYDSDSDGYVDAVVVLHAGIGAEEASAPNSGDYIWSFRSTLSANQTPTIDGKQFSAYCMFPEKRYRGGAMSMVGIGVMCHEFGHILDLPDLYSTNYSNEGAGNFTIMAGGPWLNDERTPCLMDPWSKIALDWLTPVTIDIAGTYTIPKFAADSNFAYKVNTIRNNEYFLLENRQLKGFDSYLPSKGMAVWHINTNRAFLLSQGFGNNVNNDTSQLGVGLIQADGLRELERSINRGNGGDLFPGTFERINLTPFTRPNTNLHYRQNGERQPSNVYITNITVNEDSSVTFRFGQKAVAAFTASTLSGCAPLTVNFTNNSSGTAVYKWFFGDEQSNTTTLTNPVVTFQDSGSYTVKLVAYDGGNGEPEDSITQTIQVFPLPKASFTASQNGNVLTLASTSTRTDYVKWVFPNNFTSQSPNTTHIITDTVNIFRYYLLAFNTKNCIDTAFGETYAFRTGISEINEELAGLRVFPNPFKNEIFVEFYLENIALVNIEVYNLLGAKVRELPAQMFSAGDQSLSLQLPDNTPQGIYLLKINTGNHSRLFRLIKAD